jgi:ADP-dependent NAD(P)H-hydrate dehydratase / NAD(P)H-hydrate epimerase
MENTSWLRQTTEQPLFPDMLWDRPVNKRHAGKLMIAGGHAQSFSAASRAFTAAAKAGAGATRILLPDSLQKTVGKAFPEAEFAASTPIGSFSRKALELFLDLAGWSDSVLLAGDLGKNSETAILLEKFVEKYNGLLGLAGDSLDYFTAKSEPLLNRPGTLIIGDLSQVQKIVQPRVALKQQADLAQIVDKLSNLSGEVPAELVVFHDNQIIVAVSGRVSSTKTDKDINAQELAAYASVWRLQQPEKPFEALTAAVFCYVQ